ncbi:hypothetical protein H2204_008726 [Knufia peltigerae]|uniref:Uncharacterized protein n=1 Tax=Knufia peltigerae TaxID=1002370 RepID=A0AA38XZE4_9EURO|nr:hypothetical protein H2204_008726 [Knufia peltigerae]
MKASSIKGVTLFIFLVTAALRPPPPSIASTAPKTIETVAGTTGPNHISIHFRAPCQGCFIGTDDGLELTLEIDSAEEECSSAPPRLNGLPLVLPKGNNVGHGQISFKSKASNGLGEKEIHASWQSTCLKGQASIVSVRFDDIVGHNHVQNTSGFTTSFRQKGRPTVLRLEDKPVDRLSLDDICDDWLLPNDQMLSVIPVMNDDNMSLDELLQLESDKLQGLGEEMANLHDQMRKAEGKVLSILKQDFKVCSSIKCLWQTALKKLPAIKEFVAAHFSHHKHHRDGCKQYESQTACSTHAGDQDSPDTKDAPDAVPSIQHGQFEGEQPVVTSAAATTRSLPTPTAATEAATESHDQDNSNPPQPSAEGSHVEHEPQTQPPSEEAEHKPDSHHGSPFAWPGGHGPPHHPPWFNPGDKDHPHPPPWFDPDHKGHHPHPPWFDPDDKNHPHPPPWFHGGDKDHPHHPPWLGDKDHPNPPFDGPPPFPGRPPFAGPPRPHFRPPHGPPPGWHGPPPWAFGPHGGPGGRPSEASTTSQPGFLSPSGQHSFEYKLGLAVLALLLLVIVSGLLFKLIRAKTLRYRDPRRRAERAARREERRTKKLYRKAACKHKFLSWWKRSTSTNDYEEKRQMILEQEGVLEEAMRQEIQDLQITSDFLRDVIRAEEGRATYSRNHAHRRAFTPAELEAGVGSSRLSEVPPSYSAPPPRYEEELAGEIAVVDGFTYTPSATDCTSESSVVDCSPRLSFETGRSTILTKDARG